MVILNGRLFEPGAPEVSLLNRSFKYGDGLFETIRVFRGNLLFMNDHFRRLTRGMHILGLEVEPDWLNQVRADLRRSLLANGIDDHGRVRLHVYRSGVGAYAPVEDTPYYLIESYSLKEDSYQQAGGISIGVYPDWHLTPNPLSGCKSANALPYVLAARYARVQGWDESLMLGPNGLAEASSSNLFIIRHQQLITPAEDSGCLPGVMRQVVMRVAREVRIPVKEKRISHRDLNQADEVFLTNVVRGIQPVAQIAGRKRNIVNWPLTTFLQNSLYQYVENLM